LIVSCCRNFDDALVGIGPIGELDDLRLPLRAQQRSDRSLGAVEALSAFDQTSPLTSR
jgi:hypothetical protein